jgi:hypothetical protein
MGKLIDSFKNPATRAGKYALNLFIAGDQLIGALVGYDPDETISSHIGKLEHYYDKNGIPRSRPVARLITRVLNRIDPNHCIKAIEPDEGKNTLRDGKIIDPKNHWVPINKRKV